MLRAVDRSTAPPLYDGVIVVEPYLWLNPPPDAKGGAIGTSTTVAVKAGQNEEVIVATDEEPPQAQVLAEPGGLTLAEGATGLAVSITPVEPVQPVPNGYIDGNVYRFEIIDQLGRAATSPASAYTSIILRAADPTLTDPTIERFDGAKWEPLETSPNGDSGFLVIATAFGDFAVVGHGESPYPTPTESPTAEPSSAVIATEAAASPSTSVSATPPPSAIPAAPTDLLTASLLVPLAGIAAVVVIGASLIMWTRRRRDHDDS
jgi:hypothetical protein